ncbi:hypothetical protein Tco_1042914 [Tanacetum coccineum]|uniref:Uncharacterized protein n=1 Tax=Tanacetum coccineum TaxID=301880 RepID=A0ABQ5GLX6_9ASTR
MLPRSFYMLCTTRDNCLFGFRHCVEALLGGNGNLLSRSQITDSRSPSLSIGWTGLSKQCELASDQLAVGQFRTASLSPNQIAVHHISFEVCSTQLSDFINGLQGSFSVRTGLNS